MNEPFQSQSFNRYAYVLNNPLLYTDPSGFQSIPLATAGVLSNAAAAAGQIETTTALSTGGGDAKEPEGEPEPRRYKVPVSGSGKEKADNVPDWARMMGERPYVGESGKEFARRVMDLRYGKGNWKTGTKSEYSALQKWGDRGFQDPK